MNTYVEKLFSIEGQVILVTGASRGIGMTLANSLTQSGGKVIGLARSEKPSRDLSPDVTYKQCNITDKQSFKDICQEITKEEGRIDILINSAGISTSSNNPQDDYENFSHTIDVNLNAAYVCSMISSTFMSGSKSPSIINITSINSTIGFPGNPGYVAAKGGLRMLTKALAIDLIKNNIRVNAIAPGYIHTDMTNKTHSDSQKHEQRLKHMIIPRWGRPEDIVGAAIFLISDASAYITGQDIVVDGGWTAKGLTE